MPTNCSNIAWLEPGDCGANLGDAAERSHVQERMDRQWARRSIRYGQCEGQSGKYHRKGFQSERHDRLDRVAESWWGVSGEFASPAA